VNRAEVIERTEARGMAHRFLMQRNDAVTRLIRAGETDAAIRKRYHVSDTDLSKLRGMAGSW